MYLSRATVGGVLLASIFAPEGSIGLYIAENSTPPLSYATAYLGPGKTSRAFDSYL